MRLALSAFLVCLAYLAAVDANQAFGYYYPPNPAEPRFWFNRPFTVTTTSTFTSTCTQFTNLQCTGRRRRGVLEDEDSQDQYPIAASPVETVEPSAPARLVRAADPQYFAVSPYGYQPQAIESGIYNNPYGYQPALPYYPVEQRWFFGRPTLTSTTFTTITSTSIPTCFVAGPFPQCGSG